MAESQTIAAAQSAPPCTVVILGASGDLAKRKLLPALYDLDTCGSRMLPEHYNVLGLARRQLSPEEFRKEARAGIEKFSRFGLKEDCWKRFESRLDYLSGLDKPDGFKKLRERLEKIEKEQGRPPNRIYYLSIPPETVIASVEGLDEAGLILPPRNAEGFTRVVVEKPIGHDLQSALAINHSLHKHFDESQIFRIDHYLGKESVQNLMAFRFANTIFEQIWNNSHIDSVQITVAEAEGVGTRAAYYDHAGALRDMFQNHMMQLLAMIAMEPPVSLDAEAVRDAKSNVWRAMRPITVDEVEENVVRARYGAGRMGDEVVPGYLDEKDIKSSSQTETFVALKLFIDNWRWSGVPFYLRTGKRMPTRTSAIFVQFKRQPRILFNRDGQLPPDVLTMRIQPDEGFSLDIMSKRPGLDLAIQPVRMDLHYASEFENPSPEAYERLLLDVMAGDPTLFIRAKSVELSWRFTQQILDAWHNDKDIPFYEYPAGTWGPEAANNLMGEPHRHWFTPH
jgi:glucose-6-phosphate 1-dehydrogenase